MKLAIDDKYTLPISTMFECTIIFLLFIYSCRIVDSRQIYFNSKFFFILTLIFTLPKKKIINSKKNLSMAENREKNGNLKKCTIVNFFSKIETNDKQFLHLPMEINCRYIVY